MRGDAPAGGLPPVGDAGEVAARERAKRDELSRLGAAIEQGTGRAIELARLGAAFFLEAVRAGVPQGEAATLTDSYIRAELSDRATRDFVRDRTERGPLDR